MMKMYNRAAMTALFSIVVLVLSACGGGETAQIDNSVLDTAPAPTETNPASPASPGGVAVVPEVESGIPLAVVLHDGRITFPPEVVPGPVVVNVQNSGTMQHSLAIEPAGGTASTLDMPLDQGQSGSMEVVLAAGAARVYCPVLDHATKGELVEITVAR